jgi:serine/threonine protein kinase
MSDKFIGQTIAEKYLVEEELRESSLGKIYRGKHQQMEKGVLIKILSPEFADDKEKVERFSAQARIVSRISHPNILNVTDFGTDENNTVYIVFEDAEGENLNEAIKSEGLFLLERAVKTAQQIAFALSAAHSKLILHHHLNAENILLARTANESEIVKVLGFGSVKLEDTLEFDEENPPKLFEYFAPEKLSQTGEIDERSDIYSLGVILYEMLAGEVPYTGESPAEILEKQESEPPKPLTAFRDDLPDELEPIVLRALAKDPDMRYQSADEFSDDLAKVAKDFDETNTFIAPARAAAASAGNSKNNLWKTAFVVLAGISLLAAGFIYATSMKQTDPQTMLQTDEKGIPVQPLNPATGINEKNLTVISDDSVPEYVGNSNIPISGYDQGGSGGVGDYCAWCGNGPPQGAPPPGEVITIPGDSGSQFMPNFDGGGYVLIPVPANTNTNPDANVKMKPTPAASPADNPPANTAKPTPTPKETTVPPKENPTAKPTPPVKKPTEKLKKDAAPPSSTGKNIESGKERDTQQ